VSTTYTITNAAGEAVFVVTDSEIRRGSVADFAAAAAEHAGGSVVGTTTPDHQED